MEPTSPENNRLRKVSFKLIPDQDGYPPADSEGLWAIPTEEAAHFLVDNIPFFVEDIALGDRVEAREGPDGLLWFVGLVRNAGHSTLWVFVDDVSAMGPLRQMLHTMGAKTEGDQRRLMIAVDVPPEADYGAILKYLKDGEQDGKWEYAEGAVRSE